MNILETRGWRVEGGFTPYHFCCKSDKGFTLIELIVSLGLFSFVMVITATAYLTLINADNQSRAQSDVVSNISFALETMTRSIRNGSQYACNGGNPDDPQCANDGTPTSCFSFYSEETLITTSYFSNNGVIYRAEAQCDGSPGESLTDSDVHIDTLDFYVTGADKKWQGDYYQPRVLIVVAGYMNVVKGSGVTQVPFSLQTTATQRKPDN